MRISDVIADFIGQLLQESGGLAELQRAELANRFHCVPSQINYVIATRFSPERGYVVESRRGGGGYIRIRRVQFDPARLMMHTVNAIGETLDTQAAAAFLQNLLDAAAITPEGAKLISAALSDPALRSVPRMVRPVVRASIFKQMLMA